MMSDTQHFCLRWNNYQSSITSAFENLRDDEDFVDVTLACDGKSLKAHRVVLSACSPYFRELLKSTPCKHPVIVLQDVAFSDLHSLVEFIYHGEVNVHQRNLSSFLKTAEVLRVSGLTQQADKDESLPLPPPRPPSKTNNHHPPPPDALFTSPHSPPPPAGATVNQLLRRAAAMANHTRRERHNSAELSDSSDHSGSGKRARTDPGNNNDSTSHAQDFSASGHTKQTAHDHRQAEDSNNRSPSPPAPHPDPVKREPLDLLASPRDLDNSNDSIEASGDVTRSTLDRDDDHDSMHGHMNPAHYLTAQESKLFGGTSGTFNFTMAALAGDPAGLAGLNSQLQNSPDGTPGGSSQGAGAGSSGIRWVSTGEGSGRPSKGSLQCPHCDKRLLNRDTLARHVLHMHQEPLYASKCMLCNREYRTRNSLMVHISRYHRSKRDPICQGQLS